MVNKDIEKLSKELFDNYIKTDKVIFLFCLIAFYVGVANLCLKAMLHAKEHTTL